MLGRKREMCQCPICGDYTGRIEDYEFDIDCLWMKLYCPDCDESWTEYATLTYDGYCHEGKVYDADGKECTDI